MEYGLAIPTRGPLATRESIRAIATRAEALGFSWLAVSDHLIVPRAISGVAQALLNFQRSDLARGHVARTQGRGAHPSTQRPPHLVRRACLSHPAPVPRRLVAGAAGDGVVQLPGSAEHERVTSR